MPLEGLRAWIGEVERKLGMRTRVFLVLAALAIGGAGAAIYLTLETRDDAVSESDVRALQDDLEAQIAGGGSPAGTSASELEADLRALEAKVAALEGGGAAGSSPRSGSGGADADPGGVAPPGIGSTPPEGGAGASDDGIATNGEEAAKERLRDLLDEAERRNEAALEGETSAP
jgi:hypothetical protein